MHEFIADLYPICRSITGDGVRGPTLEQDLLSLFWVLSFSTGEHSLLDIAERARIPFSHVRKTADLLTEHSLLARL